jgi:hypothetical protein
MSEADLVSDRRMMDWLLTGRWEFAHPREILAGITPQDACREMAGIPYNIARIIAHLHWWQAERISVARGGKLTEFEPRVDDWPDVPQEDWEELVKGFLNGFEELLKIVDDEQAMQRQIFDDLPVCRMLLSHPTHNAYHLGQVVLIRRLQGTWPPVEAD